MPTKKPEEIYTLSALEEDLLTVLYTKGAQYGTQFITSVAEASNHRRQLGVGSLYPTLTRLHTKGLVDAYWGDEENGPRRKYYELTKAGKNAMEEVIKFRFRLAGNVNLITKICVDES